MDGAKFFANEISAAADYVIAELHDDPESVLMIPIPNGITARQRADLLDHHDAVVTEVRRRGWQVKTHVRHPPSGTVLAINLPGREEPRG
jgi:hypothetical protein